MFFQCHNIRQVPWEMLKTEAEGLANVSACKTMFDTYIVTHMSRDIGKGGVIAYANCKGSGAGFYIVLRDRECALKIELESLKSIFFFFFFFFFFWRRGSNKRQYLT